MEQTLSICLHPSTDLRRRDSVAKLRRVQTVLWNLLFQSAPTFLQRFHKSQIHTVSKTRSMSHTCVCYYTIECTSQNSLDLPSQIFLQFNIGFLISAKPKERGILLSCLLIILLLLWPLINF